MATDCTYDGSSFSPEQIDVQNTGEVCFINTSRCPVNIHFEKADWVKEESGYVTWIRLEVGRDRTVTINPPGNGTCDFQDRPFDAGISPAGKIIVSG